MILRLGCSDQQNILTGLTGLLESYFLAFASCHLLYSIFLNVLSVAGPFYSSMLLTYCNELCFPFLSAPTAVSWMEEKLPLSQLQALQIISAFAFESLHMLDNENFSYWQDHPETAVKRCSKTCLPRGTARCQAHASDS